MRTTPGTFASSDTIRDEDFRNSRLTSLKIHHESVSTLNTYTASDVVLEHAKEHGALCFVVRRPGCGLCRETGLLLKELSNLPDNPLDGMGLFGVVKETGVDDEGLASFNLDYFPFPLYRDDKLSFYKALGDRKVKIKLCNPLNDNCNPLSFMSEWKGIMKRLDKRKIPSNFKGEGMIQGGLVLFGKDGKVKYAYQENTGKEVPLQGLLEALDAMKNES